MRRTCWPIWSAKPTDITRAEIERAQPRALKALDSFHEKGGRLDGPVGFPHLPFQAAVIKGIVQYAAEVRGSYDTVCVVGIGGSALGAWALDCGIRGPHPVQGAFTPEHPRLVILDNVDPDFTAAALASMDPQKTLVLPIAKSGGTAETVSTFLIVRDWLQQPLGAGFAARIVAITTDGKGDLYELAQKEGYRTFGIPVNVSGRFSVLTPVGLLPAALIGVDIRKLTRGAAQMTHACWQRDSTRTSPCAALCHWLVWTRKEKSIQVAFPYSNHLWGTAFLVPPDVGRVSREDPQSGRQETHVGQTPIAALGTTDQHSQVQLYIEGPNDKVFSFWAVASSPIKAPLPKRSSACPLSMRWPAIRSAS